MTTRWFGCASFFAFLVCGCSGEDDRKRPPLIAGEASDDVTGAIVDAVYHPDLASFSPDYPGLPGMMLSHDTAALLFEVGTTVGQANALLASVEATIVGGIRGVEDTASGILFIRLPSSNHAEMIPLLEKIEASPHVLLVVQDVLHEEERITRPSTDLGTSDWTWGLRAAGGNWGHEAMRVPQLWNLMHAMQENEAKAHVLVFERGYAPNHPDIGQVVEIFSEVTSGHGSHVTGIISAAFDNQKGTDGINPFARMSLKQRASLGRNLQVIASEMMEETVAINNSAGWPWGSWGVNPVDLDAETRKRFTDAGLLVKHVLLLREALKRPLPVICVSAGNDSNDGINLVDAQYNSAFANAALMHGVANILVVEAVDSSNNRADFSNVNASLSAPGVDILSLVPPSGYGLKSGTSMAAPHAAGLVSFLYALDPSLARPTTATNPVGDLLRANAVAAGGGASARIDSFATAVATNPGRVLALLVDVDDGTLDGCDRNVDEDEHGDGQVNMADFRRWRDAFLQIENDPTLNLDGLPDHAKRDLNGDRVTGSHLYPLADFNGDGVLSSSTAEVPTLGSVTDLQVLQAYFDDPSYEANELDNLIHSGDVQIDGTACLERRNVVEVISSLQPVGVTTPEQMRIHTADEPVEIMTTRADATPYTMVLTAKDAGGQVIGFLEEEFTVTLGSDTIWAPTDCGVVLTSLDPSQGKSGDRICIAGYGFLLEPTLIDVVFINPNDETRIVTPVTDLVFLSGGEVIEICLDVPTGIEATRTWDVRVEQGLGSAKVFSNMLEFTADTVACQPVEITLGGDDCRADAINEDGWIVGGAKNVNAEWRGFIRAPNGTMTVLDSVERVSEINSGRTVLGGSHIVGGGVVCRPPDYQCDPPDPLPDCKTAGGAASINNAGVIAGSSCDRAVIWNGGVPTDLGTLRADNSGSSWVGQINDSGEMIGTAAVDCSTSCKRAFWYTSGVMVDLGPKGTSNSSYGMGINNSNVIVGHAIVGPGHKRSVRWIGGVMESLGAVAGYNGTFNEYYTHDIDDLGRVVGRFSFVRPVKQLWDEYHAYLYLPVAEFGLGMGMHDLNALIPENDWVLYWANSINSNGQVVGIGNRAKYEPDLTPRCFLLDLRNCQ